MAIEKLSGDDPVRKIDKKRIERVLTSLRAGEAQFHEIAPDLSPEERAEVIAERTHDRIRESIEVHGGKIPTLTMADFGEPLELK